MKENHIFPFLWMRGEEEAVLRTEIARICEAGIRSVCLEARPHPDYAGDGWWHDVDIVIDEAKKRNIQIWILDDAHFPTGMANGSLERHPQQARRFLFTNFVDVTGPLPSAQVDVDLLMTRQVTWLDLGKPVSRPFLDETKLLSVTAARISGGDVLEGATLDLTDKVADGFLTTDIPAGTWRIYVSFSTTDIGPRPEYINYIEADSVRVLIDEVYEKHYERYKDLFGTVIAGFFSDEPGFYNRNSFDENSGLGHREALPWGREMDTLLKELYGGRLYQDLPFLFSDEKDGAHRAVRYAYMDAVSRLYSKNFCCQLGDWCRSHNVRYIGHVVEDNCGYMRLGAGVGHYFRAMAGQDMAGIDNIGYQIMPCNDIANRHTGASDIAPEFFHYEIAKMGASAAAIDPAKQGRLMCENFGAYGWRLGVRDMKWLVDYLVAQGVNYFVPHAFSMAEYPDSDCPPHFYARGCNPQFPFFCDLMKYTEQLCSLFSEGRSVEQAAVLFEAESDWAGETMKGSTVAKELITHQVDFLFIPADTLAGEAQGECSAADGCLTVNGHTMQALIVPECEYLPAKAAAFIARHPQLPVYYVNAMPKGIAGPCEDPEVLLAVAQKDRETVPLSSLGDLLRIRGCLDVLAAEKTDRNLRQYHYLKDGKDWFFLMNTSASENVDLIFTLPEGSTCGACDLMKDTMRLQSSDNGKISLSLKPYQSVILTLNPENADAPEPVLSLSGEIVPEAFRLELRAIGSDQTKTLEEFRLCPISSLDRDFSGTMDYITTVTLPELPKKAVLSAQYVFECMAVTVNGTPVSSVLTPPYEADLTGALRTGENEIRIRVASTALRNANTKPGLFGKERTIIEPTGLFGDVRIQLFN